MQYSEAMELLEKYLKNHLNIIRHCQAVSDYAYELAKKLKNKGHAIDPEKVRIAALLHDIGRCKGNDLHELNSAMILRKEGHPDLAEIVEKHGISFEKTGNKYYLPKTPEEKIVAYADGRFDEDEKVTLKQRFERLKSRRTTEAWELLLKCRSRAFADEKEIEKLLSDKHERSKKY